MVATIFQSDFFVFGVLPFVLVFAVVFAILEKTKIFGSDKRQIDAIVALVIGLITISFAYATNIIVSLVPFLSVSAIIILIFMILYGMVFNEGKFEMHDWMKYGFGLIAFIAVVIAVLIVTGAWDYLFETWFTEADGGSLLVNAIVIVVVIIAVALVLFPFGGSKGGDKK